MIQLNVLWQSQFVSEYITSSLVATSTKTRRNNLVTVRNLNQVIKNVFEVLTQEYQIFLFF